MKYTNADLPKQPPTLWQEAQEEILTLRHQITTGNETIRLLIRDKIDLCHADALTMEALRMEQEVDARNMSNALNQINDIGKALNKALADLKAWKLLAETRGAALDEAQKELAKRDKVVESIFCASNGRTASLYFECREDAEHFVGGCSGSSGMQVHELGVVPSSKAIQQIEETDNEWEI